MRGFGPGETELLALRLGPVAFEFLFEFFDLFQPGSRLARLGGLVAEAIHEGHLVFEIGLQGLGFPFPLHVVVFLQFEELRVGRFPENRFRETEIEDVRAHLVHEYAVVGDEDERALKAHQKVFQPFHGVDIEVVRRFVEKEDVSAGRQHAGELGAFAPAARKLSQAEMPFGF